MSCITSAARRDGLMNDTKGTTRMDPHRRLVKGSYRPDSGEGCVMNVISFITGDPEITDFPACSARPLAMFVQCYNDLLADSDGYLAPAESLAALELGWQTVGTADVSEAVVHAWVAELLTSPAWGFARFVTGTAATAIVDIAKLHRMAASGAVPPLAAWNAADRAARTAAHACSPPSNASARCAARAAYHATTMPGTPHVARLDAVRPGTPCWRTPWSPVATRLPVWFGSPARRFAHGAG